MNTRLMVALIAVLLAAGAFVAVVLATPGEGVTSTTLAQGSLGPVNAKVTTGDWQARIKTSGQSDLVVVENRVAPGGHFGWHSHPGPSLVIVKSGTSTFYRGDDPQCTPRVHPAGTAYLDPGGVVHIARNEGAEELVLIVTRLMPTGVPARIDEPDPGNCPFSD